MSDQLTQAVEVIETHTLSFDQAMEETGLSRMYLHQIASKNPDSVINIHGRRHLLRSWLTNYVAERGQKAQAREEAKVQKETARSEKEAARLARREAREAARAEAVAAKQQPPAEDNAPAAL